MICLIACDSNTVFSNTWEDLEKSYFVTPKKSCLDVLERKKIISALKSIAQSDVSCKEE